MRCLMSLAMPDVGENLPHPLHVSRPTRFTPNAFLRAELITARRSQATANRVPGTSGGWRHDINTLTYMFCGI